MATVPFVERACRMQRPDQTILGYLPHHSCHGAPTLPTSALVPRLAAAVQHRRHDNDSNTTRLGRTFFSSSRSFPRWLLDRAPPVHMALGWRPGLPQAGRRTEELREQVPAWPASAHRRRLPSRQFLALLIAYIAEAQANVGRSEASRWASPAVVRMGWPPGRRTSLRDVVPEKQLVSGRQRPREASRMGNGGILHPRGPWRAGDTAVRWLAGNYSAISTTRSAATGLRGLSGHPLHRRPSRHREEARTFCSPPSHSHHHGLPIRRPLQRNLRRYAEAAANRVSRWPCSGPASDPCTGSLPEPHPPPHPSPPTPTHPAPDRI